VGGARLNFTTQSIFIEKCARIPYYEKNSTIFLKFCPKHLNPTKKKVTYNHLHLSRYPINQFIEKKEKK
jgi:hypothetical protein